MTRARAWLAVHRKLVVFVVGAALTAAIQLWGTDNAWVSLGILVATGAGVYGAPNQPAPAEAKPGPSPAPEPAREPEPAPEPILPPPPEPPADPLKPPPRPGGRPRRRPPPAA